jgi:hypothetical protein
MEHILSSNIRLLLLLILIVISRKINVNFIQVCECLETIKTTASTSTTTASTSTTTASTSTTIASTSTTTASPSTTTAPKSTTTASTSTTLYGCGSPQWANDKWCDDENNNIGCNFDGGACCNKDFVGWDTFCQVSISTLGTIHT